MPETRMTLELPIRARTSGCVVAVESFFELAKSPSETACDCAFAVSVAVAWMLMLLAPVAVPLRTEPSRAEVTFELAVAVLFEAPLPTRPPPTPRARAVAATLESEVRLTWPPAISVAELATVDEIVGVAVAVDPAPPIPAMSAAEVERASATAPEVPTGFMRALSAMLPVELVIVPPPIDAVTLGVIVAVLVERPPEKPPASVIPLETAFADAV